MICEQDSSTAPDCVSEAPPDAEYVCIPSSNGEYRLQEIHPGIPSQQQDGECSVAASVDTAPVDSATVDASPADAIGEATTSVAQRRKRPREERKCKKKLKRPRGSQAQEPYETELDRFLEDTAEKNNLTVTNVKNIIRVWHFSCPIFGKRKQN